MRFETPLFPLSLSLHAAGLSIADDFPKVGLNDLIAIGEDGSFSSRRFSLSKLYQLRQLENSSACQFLV